LKRKKYGLEGLSTLLMGPEGMELALKKIALGFRSDDLGYTLGCCKQVTLFIKEL
jgi:hypothetical protein